MTDKELHRLSRRDILQLMLTQGKETAEFRQLNQELEAQLEELNRNYDRLKKRLDYKDEQIRQLQDTLDRERTNRRIELDEAGSIAEASLRLNGLFETAQKAADQYLYNIRRLYLKSLKESSSTKEENLALDSEGVAEEKREEKAVTVIEEQEIVPEVVAEREEQDKKSEVMLEEGKKDNEAEATVVEKESNVELVAEGEEQDMLPELAEKVKEEPETTMEDEEKSKGSETLVESEERDKETEAVNGSKEVIGKRRFLIFRRAKAR